MNKSVSSINLLCLPLGFGDGGSVAFCALGMGAYNFFFAEGGGGGGGLYMVVCTLLILKAQTLIHKAKYLFPLLFFLLFFLPLLFQFHCNLFHFLQFRSKHIVSKVFLGKNDKSLTFELMPSQKNTACNKCLLWHHKMFPVFPGQHFAN